MQKSKTCVFFLAACLSSISPNAFSQGIALLETPDLRLLYFDPTETYLVPHAARSFQNSLARQESIFGFDPDEKTTVLLKDFSDYANASAGALPRNTLQVDIAPMSFAFETMPTGERLFTIMNHELVHITMMDQATSGDKRYRKFFGGKVLPVSEHPESIWYSYLTTPRVWTPGWYLEGSAVFLETWMAGGMGRAQGAYDEMVFRSMVRDDAHFYDPLGLVAEGTKVDFQVGVNNYLYGTRFMNYLALHYSPEKLVSWMARREGSHRNIWKHFESTFGVSLDDAWADWIVFEHEFQQVNLESVREYPTTTYSELSDHALGSVSRAYYDSATHSLVAGFRYPGVVAHIGSLSLDDGAVKRINDIKGPMIYKVTSLAFDEASRTAFYSADNYAYRDLMAVNVDTGKAEILLKDARIGELVFNRSDRSIWGVRHLNGIATLVRVPFPYKEWEQIHSFEYGQVLYDMDISPDGELLSTSYGNVEGDQSLLVMRIDSLLAGDVTPMTTFELGQSVPEGFVFSPDGKYLFGSAYYTGISNIFRFEIATGEFEAVSNTETGFFRPLPLEDGTLVVFRYTGQGFVPVTIDPHPLEDVSAIRLLGTEVIEKYPELSEWQVGSPSDVPLEDLIVGEGKYVAIKNLGLESWYPIVEGYKDSVAAGLNFNFSDKLRLDTLEVSATYSPDSSLPSDEKLHLSVDYSHLVINSTPLSGTWRAGARYNFADFYDLFGPTKQSLKGNWFYVGFDRTLIYDDPRQLNFSTELNHYNNLDRLPRYQNVGATFGKLTTFEVDLNYSHIKSSLGSVDDEKGFKWRVIGAADYVNGDTIPKLFGNFDFGFPLWWKHSSLWFRNSAGVAFGEETDEFANFFFGGFGNNYVDSGAIKRYRNEYAMPGFELNEIFGRNFYRSMVELNLPPIRFRRVGTPGFYLSWVRPALFGTALVTNNGSSVLRQDVYSIGGQVDLRFTVLSRMNMTVSLGYAIADGKGIDQSNEFMISLKIL